jgi:hypothetical protein
MSVFTTIPNGFYVNSAGAVDARFSVADSASRKTSFTGVYYDGLIVYQQDTQEIYVCIDENNANLDSSWKLVYPASGSGTGSGEPTGSNTEIQFNDNGNFGASPRLTFGETTGLLRVSGSFEITGSAASDSFIIKSGSSFNAFKVNNEGVSVLGDFQYTPTAENGGVMYSSSNLYVGS